MTFTHFDTIIVGQGLAGTALAWTLKWRGQSVAVIDRNEPMTSSKVAAGLVTPITGQRLVLTWRFDELRQAAMNFYRRVEQFTWTSLYHERSMIRLFADAAEVDVFEGRSRVEEFSRNARRLPEGESASLAQVALGEMKPLDFPAAFRTELGGFEMPFAGQLDVRRYLSVSRSTWAAARQLFEIDLTPGDDVKVEGDQVCIPKLGLRSKRLIFCEGVAATRNAWFPTVAFRPAKGEILTVRVPGLSESRVVHGGVWLARVEGDVYRAGATYEWHQLDNVPTDAGRLEIESRLHEFLRLPFEVIDHEAAVRPIHLNQYPIVGRHPDHPQLAILNGLGSKGTLQAPFMAEVVAKLMLDGVAPPHEVDLRVRDTWFESGQSATNSSSTSSPVSKRPLPLTEQAQQAIRQAIAPDGQVARDDIGIDATAGNGHDTLFLARLFGDMGQVLAIDIQPEALQKTETLLAHRLVEGVSKPLPDSIKLVNDDHANLMSIVPLSDRDRVAAVMFNLGYLPSGDKFLITRSNTTERALRAAIELIRPGGIVTVIAYTGHPGGLEEATMVESLLASLPWDQFEVSSTKPTGIKPAPRLFTVRRHMTRDPE